VCALIGGQRQNGHIREREEELGSGSKAAARTVIYASCVGAVVGIGLPSRHRRPWGLGHIVAPLFGADPESQMDENLVRMKSFIEAGDVPSDATWQHA
jgi:hypothetical protein